MWYPWYKQKKLQRAISKPNIVHQAKQSEESRTHWALTVIVIHQAIIPKYFTNDWCENTPIDLLTYSKWKRKLCIPFDIRKYSVLDLLWWKKSPWWRIKWISFTYEAKYNSITKRSDSTTSVKFHWWNVCLWYKICERSFTASKVCEWAIDPNRSHRHGRHAKQWTMRLHKRN